MVAVVVFSKNYANSSWCLEELSKIIECRDIMEQRVLPVFYNVDPSDVRGQKRSFNEAFEQHEVKFVGDLEKVNRWREALVAAVSLSGWDVSKTASGREAECIKQIVHNILSYSKSPPTDNMIGLASRVRHVNSLLNKRSGDDVCIIGIWGMGGIGKTTIARAIYHQILYKFEGCSFLEDVRENGSDKKGLKSLQEKLLSEILLEHFRVKDCDDGICQIRRRLGHKKVLVVLDDVDNIKQLEFLAGASEWFGHGSRIIVTTRDEHLLSYTQATYAPELLREKEAMKLFSMYAFKANIPPKEYEELSRAVVNQTGHLPLALKVLGSHFCGRNLDIWQSALNVLAKIPHKEINDILKLSFDGLNILEKNIFLHIACFFKGKDRGCVTRILDSCGFEAVSGVAVLIEKSLLTILNGKLQMHDLIQDMGRWIVREYYPNTMVWVPQEIEEVMASIAKLETVEAILDYKYAYDGLSLMTSAEVFKSMKKLRILRVNMKFTSTEPTYFPEELRWLCWCWYPFQSLTLTRGMTKLVGLQIQYGELEQLQIEKKIILTNLKFMNLCGSFAIKSFRDVSVVPNLENLNLSWCSCLVEVHQSVLLHQRIIHLNLSFCDNLKILPSSIHMKSLQTLHLNGCKSLECFPEVSGEMGRLLLLNIDGCDSIKALPSSIGLLTGLIVLIMGTSVELKPELEQSYSMRMPPSNLHIQGSTHLKSLRILNLRKNNLIENDFSTKLHNEWPSLVELDLSRNIFTMLPASISQFSGLKYLNLSNCINLKELPELPPLIQVLEADGCKSLNKTGDLSNIYKWLFKISLHRCPELLKNEESESHLANCLMKSVVQRCAAVDHRLSVAVPGSKIPDWFNKQQFGNTISLNLPQNQITRMKGLAICCLFHQHWLVNSSFGITFKPSGEEKLIDSSAYAAKSADFVWIGYISIDFLQNLCRGFESDDLIITVSYGLNFVLKCGVCVVYKDDINPIPEIESCIPDYDKFRTIDLDCVSSENLQYGRWSRPIFSFGLEINGDHNSVNVKL